MYSLPLSLIFPLSSLSRSLPCLSAVFSFHPLLPLLPNSNLRYSSHSTVNHFKLNNPGSTLAIPELGRLRQKGYKFEVSLGFVENSKLAWDSQRNLFKHTNETFPGC